MWTWAVPDIMLNFYNEPINQKRIRVQSVGRKVESRYLKTKFVLMQFVYQDYHVLLIITNQTCRFNYILDLIEIEW